VKGNCAPCAGLAGQPADAPAHADLQALGKLTLEGGRYDRLFTCMSCGRDWVVEHGPGGKGWG
jgi:hypothetical protein